MCVCVCGEAVEGKGEEDERRGGEGIVLWEDISQKKKVCH